MIIQLESDPPLRECIHFGIPHSTISMDIVLKGIQGIPSRDLHHCLLGALEETRKQQIMDLVFRCKCSLSETALMSVSIISSMFHNDLTYGEVAIALEGLRVFFATKDEYVALFFFLKDEQRSPIGDEDLKPSCIQVKKSAEAV